MNRARAEEVAAALGGARVFDNGLDLIASPDVDAVLVTSIGPTHAEFVLACIAAGKPVMCEKPLAPDRPRVRADPRGRGRLRAAARDRRLHAPLRPGLPPGQGHARGRHDRRRAGPPQRPSQRDRRRGVHELHDHDRLDDPRGRHDPLAPRRGDHGRPGRAAEADAARVPAPPGPAVRDLHDRDRDPVDRRVLRQLPVRLRRPLRARGLARDRVDGQPEPSLDDHRPARSPSASPPTGASGSAPPTPPSSRPGSPGSSAASASARPPGRATRRPRWSRSAWRR